MKMTKSLRALAALATLSTLVAVTGCDVFGAKEESDDTSKATVVLGELSEISIESTNLGSTLGQLVTIDPENVTAGSGVYLPVVVSQLYAGTSPYITFTFNKGIKTIFSPETSVSPEGITVAHYVKKVSDDSTILLVDPAPAVSGATVRFNLPTITTHNQNPGDIGIDNQTFAVGEKYYIDFYVTTVDGNIGRVTVGFIPVNEPVVLGPFGNSDIQLFANTVKGKELYSMYLIDSSQVFYLKNAIPATHGEVAIPAETIKIDTTTATTFNNYINRIGNVNSSGSTYYSLEALDYATGARNRTFDNVTLTWAAVENATEYDIYTTDTNEADTVEIDSNWKYITSLSPVIVDDEYVDMVYDFPLSTNTITGYRAVRIVPKNHNQIDTTPGQIVLVDTVKPVTNCTNTTKSNGAFAIDNVFPYQDHDTQVAHSEGEIVQISGSQDLTLLGAELPATYDEAYKVTGISGSMSATLFAGASAEYQIRDLSVEDVKDYLEDIDSPLLDDSTIFCSFGDNLVGVVYYRRLYVFAHLSCYTASTTTSLNYTGTTVTGTYTVTYTDMSGNVMITQDTTDGTLKYTEN